MVDFRVRRGAFWFYYIAALSLLKVLVSSAGIMVVPIVSLAFVVLLQNIAVITGSWFLTAVSLAFIAAFAALGYFASTGQRWAFIAGMAVYALDGLLFFSVFSFFALFGLAFHGFVLWRIYSGFSVLVTSQTNEQILRNAEIARRLESDREAQSFAASPQPQPWVPPKFWGTQPSADPPPVAADAPVTADFMSAAPPAAAPVPPPAPAPEET